jgi:1-acyl-sn-glycerol-3-phosphate acyltransferase
VVIVRILYTIWAWIWAASTSAFFSTWHLLGAPFIRRPWWTSLSQKMYSGSLLLGIGVRIRVIGREHVPAGSSFVIMPNHRSYLDIPAIVVALPSLAVLFVAKRELCRIPFLGWALALSEHIKVDRGNREQAVTALKEAVRKIESGVGLAVFPEGTRSTGDRLLPFKKGGFHVALESGLPILPVSIRNSGRLFGKKGGLPRPGTIEVIVHPPIAVTGKGREAIPGLMKATREAILAGLPDSARLEPESRQAAGEEATRGS